MHVKSPVEDGTPEVGVEPTEGAGDDAENHTEALVEVIQNTVVQSIELQGNR